MFERNKWILGIIVGGMAFSGIAILDEVVIKVIFSASGAIAYSLVGSLLSTSLITSRADAGEARMVIFAVLVFIFVSIYIMIINIVTWLLSFPLWVYIIIFLVTLGLLILRFILNRKAEANYIKEYKDDYIIENSDEGDEKQEVLEYSAPINMIDEPKTIYQLLAENKDKAVIYVKRVDNCSPGLQYVQVHQKSLEYPSLKGYLKFDNAGVFREIFDADKKIWKMSY